MMTVHEETVSIAVPKRHEWAVQELLQRLSATMYGSILLKVHVGNVTELQAMEIKREPCRRTP